MTDSVYNMLFLCTGNSAPSFFQLERRIQIFVNLPITSLDKLTLQDRLDAIGKGSSDPGSAA